MYEFMLKGGSFTVYPCSQHSAWHTSKQKTKITYKTQTVISV